MCDVLMFLQVLDTYVSHPPLPPTDSEGPDYVKKPPQTGTGDASSSAVARLTEEVIASISTAPPCPDLPSTGRRVKQTTHRHRQYVGDDDDDEEERRQDASLPTPAHSDRPSSQSDPPVYRRVMQRRRTRPMKPPRLP